MNLPPGSSKVIREGRDRSLCRMAPVHRHKPLVQPVGQAEPAEWIIQRDLDGQPRQQAWQKVSMYLEAPAETGACIGPRKVAQGSGVETVAFAPPFRLLAEG